MSRNGQVGGDGKGGCPMSEQTVGWALHALEPDEEIAAIEHLDTCAECRRLAADVAEVTSGLAEAVEQREPPARLRASIVDAARTAPQVAPPIPLRPEVDDDVPPSAVPTSSARHRAPLSRRPGDRPRRSFLTGRGRQLVAAAAAVVVLGAGGGLVAYAEQMRGERDASIAQSRDIFEAVAQFDQPGAQHAFLSVAPGQKPVAAVLLNGGQRSVMSVGLAANSVDDQTYVLWGLDGGGQPTAVGTFDVPPTPERPVSVGSPAGGSFSQYAISLERGRTAPASPSSVIANGQVET